MSSTQVNSVSAALLLSECAWLYAISGMVGISLGIDGTPLSWPAVASIMTSSFLTARLLLLVPVRVTIAHAAQMMSGILVLYLTLGTQLLSGPRGFDAYWIVNLGSAPEAQELPLAAAAFLGIVLWWRGGRLASTGDIVDSLERSFKLGVLVLVIAALTDAFHSADLKIFPVMFLFFAAGLSGLGMAHIFPTPNSALTARSWPRVIGAVVAVILLSGLLFSLLQRSVLSLIAGAATTVLKGMATAVFYVLVLPIGMAIFWFLEILKTIFGRFFNTEPPPEIETPVGQFAETLQQWRDARTEDGAGLWLQVLEWTLVALVVLIVLSLLALAFKRGAGRRRVYAQGERDSVAEDGNPASDLMALLRGLVPSRPKKRAETRRFALPEDDLDVVEAFRMYFRLLVLAEKRGYPRPPTETPVEYQRTLEVVFPRSIVHMVTAAFNRACYGHHPPTKEEIDQMKGGLDRLGYNAGP